MNATAQRPETRAATPLAAQARHRPTPIGDEAELYARHHRPLQRLVARRVQLSPHLVEDACQRAWLILLTNQPERTPALFAWLLTVATRESHRLSKLEHRDTSLDAPTKSGDGLPLVQKLPARTSLDETLEARRALRALASLDERKRRLTTMQISGMTYDEIALHEGVTYRTVNKQLTKARHRLQQAA